MEKKSKEAEDNMDSISSAERLPLLQVSDHELMALYAEGESAAFGQLVKKYKDPLVNFVNKIVHDYDAAVDTAQEDQPDIRTEKVEMIKIVDTAISSLPRRYRIPFILRDMQGLAYEEVAKILSLPKGTVKSR